jgi:tRNA wybutosine-synthesizing protein 2
MKALRVPRERAEDARVLLSESGLLDKHHRIYEGSGIVEIPVLGVPDGRLSGTLAELGATVIDEREYAWRETFKRPFREILAVIDVPEGKKALLPQRWELLGHVLILKIPGGLDEWKAEIARAYARVLGARTVLQDTGGIRGRYREPVTELLLGSETVTTHVENGVKYRLDAARLMFSSGNVDERIRMSSVCGEGETVVDMFAGIGYFSLPMAVHSRPERILAYELNPLAHDYLVENLGLNRVEGVIRPHSGDCLEAGEGAADRVVMGYVGSTHEYLPKAMRILKAKGIIHYHETCPDRLLPARPVRRVTDAAGAEGRTARILNAKVIKSYAPGVSHVVLDAVVG